LVILGFPANDFGAQEPGTNEEIEQFCTLKYNVTFPMFAKVTVKGPERPPLFSWLVDGGGNPELSGEIGWNFEKFLIDRDGKVIYRYKSTVDPMSASVLKDIETALAK
jgi:glutathione peroxidase